MVTQEQAVGAEAALGLHEEPESTGSGPGSVVAASSVCI